MWFARPLRRISRESADREPQLIAEWIEQALNILMSLEGATLLGTVPSSILDQEIVTGTIFLKTGTNNKDLKNQ